MNDPVNDPVTTLVFYGGRVRTAGMPGATAIGVRDGVIAWLGDDAGADSMGARDTIDLRGATVLPAFVDAHAHVTQTGLMLTGLDLHDIPSRDALLDTVADYARRRPGEVVIGTGWDETRWADPRLPMPAELDRALGAGLGYLARVDVHSALASPALIAKAGVDPESPDVDGVRVRLDAHHAVRKVAFDSVPTSQLRTAQQHARRHAASLGIASLHEMSGPKAAGERDLASLLSLCAEEPGAEVVAYWGELGDVDTPRRYGLVGAGGDLFCDGSVGSHTAAMSAPYADAPTDRGVLRYQRDEIADHIVRAARAG
ncbi:MAG: amidohydrolase family protein, partial [Frankia sp.]|nr:amidohydrolase family protein [Frankia sp.]